jgi:hypothetical protein
MDGGKCGLGREGSVVGEKLIIGHRMKKFKSSFIQHVNYG